MQEAGADAAVGGEAEHALEFPGVVVAVPDRDLVLVEVLRDGGGVMARDGEHQRRRAVGGVAVERHVIHRAEALERAAQQRLLVLHDGLEIELEHVLGGGADAGQRLERERAELPAVRRLVGRRVELVRVELLEDLRAGAEHRDVRPEPLVRAAADDVGAELGEVEAPVRRGVDGVDVHARADPLRRGDDPRQVRHGPDRVRRCGHRDPLGALRKCRLDRAGRQLQGRLERLGEAHTAPARSAAITHGRTLES